MKSKKKIGLVLGLILVGSLVFGHRLTTSKASPESTLTPGETTIAPTDATASAVPSASAEATATATPTEEPTATPTPSEEPDSASFTFTASGDNLIHTCLYEQARSRGKKNGKGYDFSYFYKNVKSFFMKKDLNWINQETLVNNGYAPAGYPCFSTPTQVVKDLRKIGFTVFNTASNHSYDKKAGGLTSSMKFWNSMAKKAAGSEAYQVGITKRSESKPQLIYEVNGIKVGFLSYTYGTNGISIPSDSKYRIVYLSEKKKIEKQVKALRKKVDVVMVSCHWGVENSHTISADQKSLAKKLVKWGADVIIGTHPHVLQDCAWIKSGGRKGFCAYSLGNFLSGQSEQKQIVGGTLNCTIKVNKNTGDVTIQNPKLKPMVTIYGSNRSNIRLKWLANYNANDAKSQSSHYSKASFTSIVKKVVRKKFLDL